MSGFDKRWLALREPVDQAARATSLLDRFCIDLNARPAPPTIMDIGCGTGSTYRALSPLLPAGTQWRLVDYEAALLEEARRQTGASDTIRFQRQDLNRFGESLLEGVDIVTASALFDLCSAEFCSRFIEQLSKSKTGLYAALNYNGIMEWSVKHPLDITVIANFNLHQRTDKGFGPALGPDASRYLVGIARGYGYQCLIAESPWRLGPEVSALQTEFLKGLGKPLIEIGQLSSGDIADWLEFRLSNVGVNGSVCIVGHTDVLAVA